MNSSFKASDPEIFSFLSFESDEFSKRSGSSVLAKNSFSVAVTMKWCLAIGTKKKLKNVIRK